MDTLKLKLFSNQFYSFFLNKNNFDTVYFRGSTNKNFLLIILSIIFSKKIIYAPTRYLEDDLNFIFNEKNFFFIY